MKIIGVCGQPASGKDTVAEFFISKGFQHISLGDTLRAEMRSQGLAMDRASMSVFAAEAKEKRGLDFLAQLAIGKIAGNAVISGIRGTVEVTRFRQEYGLNLSFSSSKLPCERVMNEQESAIGRATIFLLNSLK